MQIDLLLVGTTYKSFKELALALGYEKIPAGNSKKAVMAEIQRFYKIEKIGNSIKIVEKYDAPLPSVRRTGNNIKYSPLLREILLLEGDGILTRHQWQSKLGIISSQYFELIGTETHERYIATLLEEGFEFEQILNFETRTERKLSSIFMSFLKFMERSQEITYLEKYKILEDSDRFANEEETEYIKETETAVLKEMWVKSLFELNYYKRKKFYKEVAAKVASEKGWNYIKVIDISFRHFYVADDEALIVEKKKELRNIIKNILLQEIHKIVMQEPEKYEKRKEKAQAKMTVGTMPEGLIYKLPADFEKVQSALVERFF